MQTYDNPLSSLDAGDLSLGARDFTTQTGWTLVLRKGTSELRPDNLLLEKDDIRIEALGSLLQALAQSIQAANAILSMGPEEMQKWADLKRGK